MEQNLGLGFSGVKLEGRNSEQTQGRELDPVVKRDQLLQRLQRVLDTAKKVYWPRDLFEWSGKKEYDSIVNFKEDEREKDNFEATFAGNYKFWAQHERPLPDHYLRYLEKSGKIDVIYSGAIGRIEDSTDIFQNYEEAGLMPAILDGFKTERGERLRWSSRWFRLPRLLRKNLGFHSLLVLRSKVNYPAPFKREMVECLARDGVLPGQLAVALHEKIHELDNTDVNLMIRSNKDHGNFTEVHAWLVDVSPISGFTPDNLAEILVDKPYGFDRQKSEKLIKAIHGLIVLGFRQREISRLIAISGQRLRKNNQENNEPYIVQYFDQFVKEHGITPDDLDKLKFLDKKAKQLDMVEAIQITRQEISKAEQK